MGADGVRFNLSDGGFLTAVAEVGVGIVENSISSSLLSLS